MGHGWGVYNVDRMNANPDDARLTQAQAFHQAGRIDQAAELYRQILLDHPHHAAAHHLLGLVCSQRGAAEPALAHLRQAVGLAPHEPTFHNNLGEALRRAGETDAAIASFRQALALQPSLAEAHYNLANTLKGQGRLAEAIAHYEQAIAARPDYARAHHNLGTTVAHLGRADAAIDHLRRAVAIQPGFAEAHQAAAELCRDAGRTKDAIEHFQAASRLRPEDGDLHFQLGYLFSELGQIDASVHHYRQAARLQPGSAEVRSNLGIALQATGRLEEAIGCFHEAIDLNPGLANIHRNLGLAEKLRGRTDEARAAYRQSLALAPDDSLLRLEAETIAPFILTSHAAIDRYRSELDTTLDRMLAEPFPIDLTQLHVGEACPPYVLVYQGRDDRALKAKWARIFDGRLPSGHARPGTERPRLGFVVTHTHEGVFARSLKGILNRLPATRFRVTIVCNRAAVAQFLRETLGNAYIGFLVVPQRLDEAADAIRRARFDLLYYWEIGTDATNYFLPFFRLAPVQCTSWGWQVTSGIPQVDAYISSRLIEPPDAASHYSEHLVLLDTLLTAYTRPPAPERRPDRAHYGFRPDQHIYFCAQSLLKIHPDFDPLAAEILRGDPAGVLVFVGLDDPHLTALVRQRMRETMADVMDRIHFLPRQEEPRFLGLLALADVVLDTRHYGGVNTSYQALATGTPVVTWPGEFQRGRYTLGAYRRMGILDCVADSAASYVEKALGLGTDKVYREQVSGWIRDASPVLFDDAQAAVELADYFDQAVAEARSRDAAPTRRAARRAVPYRSIAFLDPSTSDYAVDTPYQQPLGGSQSAVCYLAEQLAALGHRIYMVSRVSRPRVVGDVACLAWREDTAATMDLLEWLGVDLAVFVNAPPDPRLAALKPRTRLALWTHHADDQPAVGNLTDRAHREALDGIAFVSRWQRDAYLSRFDLMPERCVVMPNAIGPAFRELFGPDERILDAKPEPILAYSSAPYRGLDLLLDVFPAIRAVVPAARLRIFSSMLTYQSRDKEPLYAQLYEQARQMPGVDYVGAVPQAELAAALKGAAVLAYPNTFPETFCITALEALAAGCQVVSSDLGALPETMAGHARLVSWEDGPEAYRDAFVAAVIEALSALGDPANEARLRRQVDDVNRRARWESRAEEWGAWVRISR
jgi:protein O-GlcNAc transferase